MCTQNHMLAVKGSQQHQINGLFSKDYMNTKEINKHTNKSTLKPNKEGQIRLMAGVLF